MYHLIATKTVVPSLKSVREYCEKPRRPVFIKSSPDPEVCYDHAIDQLGGRSYLTNKILPALNGAPIFVTGDWTYWLVDDAA